MADVFTWFVLVDKANTRCVATRIRLAIGLKSNWYNTHKKQKRQRAQLLRFRSKIAVFSRPI